MHILWRTSLLGSVVGLAAFVAAPSPAQAACTASGNVVTCTGNDEDGFIGGNNLTISIDQTAFVQSIYDGNPSTLCPAFRSALRLGDNATVSNRGQMLGRGNCGVVIESLNGLRFTNDGGMLTDSEVAFAVLTGDRFDFVNNGTMATVNAGSTVFVGGGNGTFTNATNGVISTTGADSNGVFVENVNTITNNGRIVTVNTGSFGIDAGASNTILNTGTITTTGIVSHGIRVRGTGNSITNRGTISALPTATPRDGEDTIGILAESGTTTVINSGTIAGDYAGVELIGTGNRLTNDGTISARATTASTLLGGAVVIEAGSATVTNSGTIRGTGTAAIRTRQGAGLTLTNTGRIEGDIVMGSSGGTVALGTGSVITGTIFGATNNATALTLSGTGSLSTPIVNVGSLQQITEGAWVLSRRYDFQTVIQQAGTLTLSDGIRVSGTIFNQAGARLVGVGPIQRVNPTIGGSLSLGGTLAPGLNATPGAVLSLQGSATLVAGSRLEFDVSPTANDRFDVAGTVSGSSAVQINYSGAPVRDGQTFTILTASSITSPSSQSCVGTVAEGTALGAGCFTVADNSPVFVRTSLVVSGTTVVARAQRQSFTTAAVTANELSLAAGLDRALTTATGVVPALSLLDQQSAAEARTTISNLTTELPAANQTWGIMAANTLNSAMSPWLELSPADSPRGQWRTWGTLFGRSGERKPTTDSLQFDYEVRGGIAGVDMAVVDGLRVGVSASRSSGESQLTTGGARSEQTATSLGAYASYAGAQWRLGAAYNIADGNVDTSRNQTVGGVTSTLTSSADTGANSGLLQLSYATSTEGWLFKPTAALTYARSKIDGTAEVGGIGITTANSRATSLRGDVGIRAIAKPGPIHLNVAVFWSQNLKDNDRLVSSRLTNVPGSDFVIMGPAEKRGWLNTQVGVNIEIIPGMMARLIWSGILNDRMGGQMGSAGLSYRF